MLLLLWLAVVGAVDLEVECTVTCSPAVQRCFFQRVEDRRCFGTSLCNVDIERCDAYIIEHVETGDDPLEHCPEVTYSMPFNGTVCEDCTIECEPAVYKYQCTDIAEPNDLCAVSCPVLTCPAPPIETNIHKYEGWLIYGIVSITLFAMFLIIMVLAGIIHHMRKTRKEREVIKYVQLTSS